MKKVAYIFAILVSLFVCEKAAAQLNITAAIENEPERLYVGQISYSYLYKSATGAYEYWAKTDNQFDDLYTNLYLGDTPQSAVQTLKDLLSIMDKETAFVNVQQYDGEITLTFARQLGIKMLWIKQSGQGGRSWISYPMIERFIRYFQTTFPEVFENDNEG